MDPDILNNQSALYQSYVEFTTQPDSFDVSQFEGWSRAQVEQFGEAMQAFNNADYHHARGYQASHMWNSNEPTEGYDGRLYADPAIDRWTQAYADGGYTQDGNFRYDHMYRDLGVYGDLIEGYAAQIIENVEAGLDPEMNDAIKHGELVPALDAAHADIAATLENQIQSAIRFVDPDASLDNSGPRETIPDGPGFG